MPISKNRLGEEVQKMECLVNFLSDDAQRSLINMVQNRDETFEYELDSYRKLFMVEMDYCIGRGNEKYCGHDECRHRDSCVKIHDILHDISADKINRFFKGIRQCYLYWIDSKTTLALEAFDSLLKEYGLISEGGAVDDEKDELLLKDIENRVFFRARLTDEFLSKKEMFHVPYNKRYNIKNERFSLTGQPVLYLGNSIADVVEELGINVNSLDSLDRLRVSSFEFIRKYTKVDEVKKRIFDLRCNITNDLFHVTDPSYSEKKFFRTILSQICSFQKRKELEEYAFKEEYVIPQMFAQILKQNNYDGICYYSTKRFHGYKIDGKGTSIADIDQEMQYRENLALFTHMSEDGGSMPYDNQLFEGLEISMPVAVKNIKLCSENDLWKLKETISRHNENIQRNDSKDEQKIDEIGEPGQEITGYRRIRMRVASNCDNKARRIVDFYNKIFSRVRVNGRCYSDTKLGQAHVQLLIGILNRLLVESELVEGYLREKEKDDEEEGTLPLQLCNIWGDRIGKGNEKEVHDKGKLHRARIVFLYKINTGHEIMIAVNRSKIWEELIHVHDVDGDEEYISKVQKYMELPLDKPVNLGNFINKKVAVDKRPFGGYGIKIDFEYVTVEALEFTKTVEDDCKLLWKSKNELSDIFIRDYNKMSCAYQQAFPILLKQFRVMTRGEDGNE